MTGKEFEEMKSEIERDLLFRYSKDELYPMLLNAIELAIRQKTEIAKYRNYINQKLSGAADLISAYNIEVAKSQAIKEFADKTNIMITKIYNKHIFGANDLEAEEKDAIINFSDDVTSGLGNLLKEMVGDK